MLCSVFATSSFDRIMNKHFCSCKPGFTGDGNICTGKFTLHCTGDSYKAVLAKQKIRNFDKRKTSASLDEAL